VHNIELTHFLEDVPIAYVGILIL